MPDRDRQLLERLLPIFREEAREHITTIADRLQRLEETAGPATETVVEEIFREAHSLKAAARSVGRRDMETVCGAVESVFAALKRGDARPTETLRRALDDAADALEDFLAAPGVSPPPQAVARAQALGAALDAALRTATGAPRTPPAAPIPAAAATPAPAESPRAPPALPEPPAEPPAPEPPDLRLATPEPFRQEATPSGSTGETVRLSIERLDLLLLQAEEMLAEKLASRRLAAELRGLCAGLADWKRDLANAPAAAERLSRFEARLAALVKLAADDARNLGTKVDRLLFDIKRTLTLPCSSILRLLPRVVRELSQSQGKEIALQIRGADLEMDRRILEELKDPILHLVRNAVDHAIEPAADRVAAGKPARATIVVTVVAGDGDKVAFAVADDGAGIAFDRLAAAAEALGLLARERPPDADLAALVFQSGLSTRAEVTDLSGRGLGLAIVREKVERLGGTVSVSSERGRGTIFRLVVPLTLATYRGILVKVAGRRVIVPTLGVERVLGVAREAVRTIESRPIVDVEGVPVPLVALAELLELPASREGRDGRRSVLTVATMAGRVAVEVDEIEGDQEVLMKPLGRYLARVRNVQGATVLPTGEIVPILNVHDLVKSASRVLRSGRPAAVAAPAATEDAPRRTILVAEDSITARMLLRNILEAYGYRVRTAVDGLDAWTSLALEPVDLVVSDVEMPRMNGLELTRRIRADKRLADLPVILVTALESAEHREQGVEAGADAYIGKGGFEQDRLLEAIGRLT